MLRFTATHSSAIVSGTKSGLFALDEHGRPLYLSRVSNRVRDLNPDVFERNGRVRVEVAKAARVRGGVGAISRRPVRSETATRGDAGTDVSGDAGDAGGGGDRDGKTVASPRPWSSASDAGIGEGDGDDAAEETEPGAPVVTPKPKSPTVPPLSPPPLPRLRAKDVDVALRASEAAHRASEAAHRASEAAHRSENRTDPGASIDDLRRREARLAESVRVLRQENASYAREVDLLKQLLTQAERGRELDRVEIDRLRRSNLDLETMRDSLVDISSPVRGSVLASAAAATR